jgi:hypothetical protein
MTGAIMLKLLKSSSGKEKLKPRKPLTVEALAQKLRRLHGSQVFEIKTRGGEAKIEASADKKLVVLRYSGPRKEGSDVNESPWGGSLEDATQRVKEALQTLSGERSAPPEDTNIMAAQRILTAVFRNGKRETDPFSAKQLGEDEHSR